MFDSELQNLDCLPLVLDEDTDEFNRVSRVWQKEELHAKIAQSGSDGGYFGFAYDDE